MKHHVYKYYFINEWNIWSINLHTNNMYLTFTFQVLSYSADKCSFKRNQMIEDSQQVLYWMMHCCPLFTLPCQYFQESRGRRRNPARNNVAIQESVVWMDFGAVKCNISSRVDMQHYLVLCKVIIWPPLGFSHLSPKEMKRNKSYIHTSRSTI